MIATAALALADGYIAAHNPDYEELSLDPTIFFMIFDLFMVGMIFGGV